jgi:DNA invertase Pin-like site-specific DNA recombinase
VINEYYVAETSKKQRAAKRTSALQGKVMGYPPYGYTVGEDKSLWLVDEYAAGVVTTIFKKYVAGETFAAIIRHLDANGVLMPRFYAQSKKA